MVSRWLARIANYPTGELAADLFGTGGTTPTHIYIYTTLQPWQDASWQIAVRAMGWEVLDTRHPLPGDLFVTNILGPEASDALDVGMHVLAQSAQYFSSAQDSPLGGALNGLTEIAMQPDALVTGTPPLLVQARDEALAGTRPSAPVQNRRVALSRDAHMSAGQVLDQWMQGRSVLIIDPNAISPNRLTQILAMEDADGGLVIYQK